MAKKDDSTGTEERGDEQRFEGEFDEDRAKRLIANLRDEISGLKEQRDTLQVEADKVEGLEERIATAEGETKAAQKALYVSRAQAKHGLSDEDAEEFLSDLDDEEKILARAERLAARGQGSQEENGGEGNGENGEEGERGSGEESGDGLSGKPKPGLTPGTGGSGDDGEIDEDALFDNARSRRGY
jgi:hypothetical protein